MSHVCPYCGSELDYEDTWFIGRPDWGNKQGQILRCRNHEGFDNEEDARQYDEENLQERPEDWEEIVCESAVHSVSGSFYTDITGTLRTGYPC